MLSGRGELRWLWAFVRCVLRDPDSGSPRRLPLSALVVSRRAIGQSAELAKKLAKFGLMGWTPSALDCDMARILRERSPRRDDHISALAPGVGMSLARSSPPLGHGLASSAANDLPDQACGVRAVELGHLCQELVVGHVTASKSVS